MKTILLFIALVTSQLLSLASDETRYFVPNCKITYDKSIYNFYTYSSYLSTQAIGDAYLKGKKNSPHIEFTTSFAADPTFESKQSNPYASSPGPAVTDGFTEGYNLRRYYQYDYDNSYYEVNRETIQAGPVTFTLIKYLQESCGIGGKESSFAFYCYADTVFNGITRFQAECIGNWGDEKNYEKEKAQLLLLLHVFDHFDVLTTDLDGIAALQNEGFFTTDNYWEERIENSATFYRKNAIRLAKRKKQELWNQRTYTHYWSNLMSEDTYDNYRFNGEFDLLGDTVASSYRRFQLKELTTFKRFYDGYHYSLSNNYRLFDAMHQGTISDTDYLNHINERTPYNVLDTLEQLIKLNHFPFDKFRNLPTYQNANSFSNYLSARFFFSFENEFIRTFYKNTLRGANPKFYPYVHMLNDSISEHYFFFNPQPGHTSQIIMTTFRQQEDNTWTHRLDTLPERIKFKGNDQLKVFNNYYILHQRDSIFLVDTQTSPATCTSLHQYPDTLKHFIYYCNDVVFRDSGTYVFPIQSQFQRDKMNTDARAQLWQQIEANKDYSLPPRYYKSERYGHIDIGHGDTLVPPNTYYQYARMLLAPSRMCYNVNYTLRDLNRDGITELFTYAISNGQAIAITCYTIAEGKHTEVSKEQALQWLQHDDDFMNLRGYSMIGNSLNRQ